jgi:hypothetical protein
MPRYSVEQVIAALRAHHGLLVLAAGELHCSRTTIYSFVERFPVVAEVLREERERFIDLAEQGLMHHLQEESPWAISLVLRTLGRSRGYEERSPAPRVSDSGEVQEWPAIQATLLSVLQAYPEARWAVVKALGAHVDESENGHSSGA